MSLPTPRGLRRGWLVTVALALIATVAVAETPLAPAAMLQGVARDPTGLALVEVEVVVSGVLGGQRSSRALTDADGRFLFEGLSPGLYRVTAVKTGYHVAILRINTVVRNTLDLVLRPAVDPEAPGHRPETSDWVLRLPGRDLLEELGVETLLSPADGATKMVSWRPEVSGQVEQWYWAGTPLAGETVEGTRGLITSLKLAAPVTPGLHMKVKGDRYEEDLALAGGKGPSTDMVRHRVLFDVGVNTGLRSELAMQAYVDRGIRDVLIPSGRGGVESELPQGRERAWGYDAQWTRTVGRSGSVEVGLGLHDAVLDLQGDAATALYGVSAGRHGSRAASFSSAVTTGLGERHAIRVGLRAERFRHDLADRPLALSPWSPFLSPGPSGWGAGLFAADEWSVGGPVTVSYGLDYQQAAFGERLAFLVPQVGLAYAPKQETRFSSSLSWVASALEPGLDGRAAGREDRLGYRIVFEQGIGQRNTVAVHVESRPVQHAFIGNRADEPPLAGEARQLFQGDAGADTRWCEGSWTIRFRGGSGSVGYGQGRADGRLATTLPGDVPVLHVGRRSLDLSVARAEFRWDASGTLIEVRLKDMAERTRDGLGGGEYEQLAVFVDQELPFLKIRDTRWRFMLSVEESLIDEPTEQADTAGVAELRQTMVAAHRVSGGLAVDF